MIIFIYSASALAAGFILDRIFGDPYNFPHIVRLIGRSISYLERILRRTLPKTKSGERLGGSILLLIEMFICAAAPFLLLFLAYRTLPPLGFFIETFLCYQLLAARSLKDESMKVYESLRNDDIEAARKNLSMIVGRDTEDLDRGGITRAAVETVAENTSDGVSAPLIYIALGGAALGCLYKAVNTMDSMLGYKNERYINFGRAAAKTDDVFNFIPSRLCALLMIVCAYLVGVCCCLQNDETTNACSLRYDAANALRVWRRDRRKHLSPNSAQTETVCAGALGIRLAGPASYHGTVYNKAYIGDNTRPIEDDDIVRANRLMYAVSNLTLILAILLRVMGAIYFGAI